MMLRKYKEAQADARAALQVDPNFEKVRKFDAILDFMKCKCDCSSVSGLLAAHSINFGSWRHCGNGGGPPILESLKPTLLERLSRGGTATAKSQSTAGRVYRGKGEEGVQEGKQAINIFHTTILTLDFTL